MTTDTGELLSRDPPNHGDTGDGMAAGAYSLAAWLATLVLQFSGPITLVQEVSQLGIDTVVTLTLSGLTCSSLKLGELSSSETSVASSSNETGASPSLTLSLSGVAIK